jgi:hypothetical protein
MHTIIMRQILSWETLTTQLFTLQVQLRLKDENNQIELI